MRTNGTYNLSGHNGKGEFEVTRNAISRDGYCNPVKVPIGTCGRQEEAVQACEGLVTAQEKAHAPIQPAAPQTPTEWLESDDMTEALAKIAAEAVAEGEGELRFLREKYAATKAVMADYFADFNALPNASNFRGLLQTMRTTQDAFQAVLDEQERQLANR